MRKGLAAQDYTHTNKIFELRIVPNLFHDILPGKMDI